MSERLRSCIYRGWVRHRRFAPVEHAFRYPLFMMFLDLDELDRVFRGRWLWSVCRPALARYRREDHLGDPSVPLRRAVEDLVEERTGERPVGPVRLLTHLRYFGYVFNPISLFYCFDPGGRRIRCLVADVSNTPWKERHRYVLPVPRDHAGGPMRFSCPKEMHVSPFLGMDMSYAWTVTEPGRRLAVHIENRDPEGSCLLDATLLLSRREIGSASLAGVLLRHPAMTARVTAAIHLQALRLWLKKVPFHPHPERAASVRSRTRP